MEEEKLFTQSHPEKKHRRWNLYASQPEFWVRVPPVNHMSFCFTFVACSLMCNVKIRLQVTPGYVMIKNNPYPI